ncbi:MAG: hypothetical protein KF866_09590 [Phycisphaeraceae bacterium]|nr:hypothetical protein [Phycisphaeraceae bacterium]
MRSTYIAAIVSTCGVAAAQIDFSIQTLLMGTVFNSPSSLVVDDNGVIHLAYTSQFGTDSTGKEVWYANNASGAFQFNQVTNNTVREEFPYLFLGPDGVVHLAFHTGTATTNKIRYVNSAMADLLHAGEADIIDITPPGFIKVKGAADATGTTHFVFYNQGDGPDDIFYTSWSATNGVSPLVNLSIGNNPSGDDTEPSIAVGPDGVVHVVYQAGWVLGGPLRYLNNAGGSFAFVPTGVSGTIADTQVGVSPDNIVTITFERGDSFNVIENDGSGFTPEAMITPLGQYRPAFYDKFAYGPDGRRYFAFASNINTRGIYLIVETENGFTTPQRLDVDAPLSFLSASIGINSSGLLAISLTTGASRGGTVVADLFLATADLSGGCPADFSGASDPNDPDYGIPDGQVDASDFFYYLDQFAAGNLAVADLTGSSDPNDPAYGVPDGQIDATDFFYFLDIFVVGCP